MIRWTQWLKFIRIISSNSSSSSTAPANFPHLFPRSELQNQPLILPRLLPQPLCVHHLQPRQYVCPGLNYKILLCITKEILCIIFTLPETRITPTRWSFRCNNLSITWASICIISTCEDSSINNFGSISPKMNEECGLAYYTSFLPDKESWFLYWSEFLGLGFMWIGPSDVDRPAEETPILLEYWFHTSGRLSSPSLTTYIWMHASFPTLFNICFTFLSSRIKCYPFSTQTPGSR